MTKAPPDLSPPSRATDKKKRLRILHIVPRFSAEGGQHLALNMLRVHDRSVYEPAVAVYMDTPDDMRPEFETLNVPIFHMEWQFERWESKGFLGYSPLAWKTYQICRSWKPDGIICYSLGAHVFIGLGAWLAGVRRLVVHIGNSPPANDRARSRKTAWVLRLGRPFTRYEIAVSHHVKELVQKAYAVPPRRVKLIHNSASVEEYHRRADASRRNGPRPAQPVVGMVASLEPHKDQATLIKALALVRERRPDVVLRLVGDGSLRSTLERLVYEMGLNGAVQFLGTRRDVPEQLADMDVFAFSTTPDEGFGIALVEALAAGVPVVASDVGACREVLEGGRYGRLVPPAEPRPLADAIVALLEDPEERRRLGLQGYPYARERFSALSTTRAYEEALFG